MPVLGPTIGSESDVLQGILGKAGMTGSGTVLGPRGMPRLTSWRADILVASLTNNML